MGVFLEGKYLQVIFQVKEGKSSKGKEIEKERRKMTGKLVFNGSMGVREGNLGNRRKK